MNDSHPTRCNRNKAMPIKNVIILLLQRHWLPLSTRVPQFASLFVFFPSVLDSPLNEAHLDMHLKPETDKENKWLDLQCSSKLCSSLLWRVRFGVAVRVCGRWLYSLSPSVMWLDSLALIFSVRLAAASLNTCTVDSYPPIREWVSQ